MPPLPMLLVQGKGVADDAVAALLRSARVQLFRPPDLQSSATAFARHSARATLVATLEDPLRELVFIRTSGFTGPLVFAIDERNEQSCEDLLSADVLGCLTLPIEEKALDRVLDLVEQQPLPATANIGLGLFLDAVDRTARHDKSVVRLTPREFALLHCLISSKGPVAVRDIYDYVWGGPGGDSMYEIVHVNVSQLRKKLERIGLRGAIRTVRDFGYGLSDSST